MNAFVFPDKALAKHAGRFVWLRVDTEKEQNARFAEKYPIDAWPTLLVIDPQREQVVLKWLGSANVADLGGLLDDGARALDPAHADEASKLLVQADAANAQAKWADAAKLYEAALKEGGPQWPEAPRVVQSLDFALQESGDLQACARVARQRAATLQPGSAYANLVATGLQCATSAPPADWRGDAIAHLRPLNEAALKIPGLLADDRSGIYESLVDLADQQGDAALKKKLAGEWLTFLEGEAAKAKTPAERSAFDPHRVAAAIELGEPARALPALQQSEKEMPEDYNPPAREALIYLELGKLDDALAANDRALAKVYGPRTLRILDNRIDILAKLHRTADARQTAEKALATAKALPPGQRSDRSIARFQKRLAELSRAPDAGR